MVQCLILSWGKAWGSVRTHDSSVPLCPPDCPGACRSWGLASAGGVSKCAVIRSAHLLGPSSSMACSQLASRNSVHLDTELWALSCTLGSVWSKLLGCPYEARTQLFPDALFCSLCSLRWDFLSCTPQDRVLCAAPVLCCLKGRSFSCHAGVSQGLLCSRVAKEVGGRGSHRPPVVVLCFSSNQVRSQDLIA